MARDQEARSGGSAIRRNQSLAEDASRDARQSQRRRSMNGRGLTTGLAVGLCVLLVLGTMIVGNAQRGRSSVLEDGPWTYRTADADVRAVVIATELSHPWSIAFLPGGDMLVTERAGRLRIIRHGVLDPKPVPGLPQVYANRLDGLLDLALHPNFAENKLVY